MADLLCAIRSSRLPSKSLSCAASSSRFWMPSASAVFADSAACSCSASCCCTLSRLPESWPLWLERIDCWCSSSSFCLTSSSDWMCWKRSAWARQPSSWLASSARIC
eukprot:4793350-Prymnesium_polylepis.1